MTRFRAAPPRFDPEHGPECPLSVRRPSESWRSENLVLQRGGPTVSASLAREMLYVSPAPVVEAPDLLAALDRATPGTLSADPEFMRDYFDDGLKNPLSWDDDDSIDPENLPDHREPARLAPVDRDLLPDVDPRLVHIDWLSARWSCEGLEKYFRGDVQELYRDNRRLVKRKMISTWKEHESWSAKIQVKINGGFVEVSGNLNKWLHAQALFGISHPFDLICAWCEDYRRETGLNIRPASPYHVRISRIDLTSHIDLDTVARADNFLSSMRYVLRARLPGETMPGDVVQYRNTVYWGQHSRSWSLKIYNKFRELKRHWAKGLETLNYWEVPESVLRVELTLRGPELIRYWANLRNVSQENLKREGWSRWSWSKTLACAGSWDEYKCMGAFMKFVRGRIQAFDNFAALPPANMTNWKDLALFRSWQSGDPIDKNIPPATWKRYRKRFKAEYSIDLQRPPNLAENKDCGSVISDGLHKLRTGNLYVFQSKMAENQISNARF